MAESAGTTTPADYARDLAAATDPASAVRRLCNVLAHAGLWTGNTLSPAERASYESAFADEFVRAVMALGIRVGDEVHLAWLDNVVPAPTNIDAHWIVDAIDGGTATLHRRPFKPGLTRAPLVNLLRVSDGHRCPHLGDEQAAARQVARLAVRDVARQLTPEAGA
jgi:hypothetical protein